MKKVKKSFKKKLLVLTASAFLLFPNFSFAQTMTTQSIPTSFTTMSMPQMLNTNSLYQTMQQPMYFSNNSFLNQGYANPFYSNQMFDYSQMNMMNMAQVMPQTTSVPNNSNGNSTQEVTGRGILIKEGDKYYLKTSDTQKYEMSTTQDDILAAFSVLANQDIVISVKAIFEGNVLKVSRLNIESTLSEAKKTEVKTAIDNATINKPNAEVRGRGKLVKEGDTYYLEVSETERYILITENGDVAAAMSVLHDDNVVISVNAYKNDNTLKVVSLNVDSQLTNEQKTELENAIKQYVLSNDDILVKFTNILTSEDNKYYISAYDQKFEITTEKEDIQKTLPILANKNVTVQISGTKNGQTIKATYLNIASQVSNDLLNQIRVALGQQPVYQTQTTTNNAYPMTNGYTMPTNMMSFSFPSNASSLMNYNMAATMPTLNTNMFSQMPNLNQFATMPTNTSLFSNFNTTSLFSQMPSLSQFSTLQMPSFNMGTQMQMPTLNMGSTMPTNLTSQFSFSLPSGGTISATDISNLIGSFLNGYFNNSSNNSNSDNNNDGGNN